MVNRQRETYWLKGNGEQGDGQHVSYSSFWKMLCYRDTDEPVSGKRITITYAEYSE